MRELERLAELSRSRDVYLICFEKPSQLCHRYLLLKIARGKLGVPVEASIDLEAV